MLPNRRNSRLWPLVLAGSLMASCHIVLAADSYQTSFEEGKDDPTGWRKPDRGIWETSGAHSGRRCISVTDDNTAGHLWQCKADWLTPHRLYRYTFWYRTESPDAAPRVRVGLNFANHDFTGKPEWQEQSFVFQAPKAVDGAEMWFGQWRLNGKAFFDDLKIEPVGASFLRKDGVVLGEDEKIEKGTYLFHWKIRWQNSAYSRVIQEIKTESRGDCLRFWEPTNGYFIHKYHIPGHRQLSGAIKSKMNIVKGRCIIEASRDQKSWQEVAQLAEGKEHEIRLPANLFPADEIYVRASFPAEIQVYEYQYEAPLEGHPPDIVGQTNYFRGHLLVADNGAIKLKFEEGTKELVSLATGAGSIGGVGAQLAQFSKQGQGYKGTGIGWTGEGAVKRFDVKEQSASKCVVDVTCEWADVPAELQPCEATYRLTVYAGQPWFESRFLSIKNTGKAACTIKGYYHLLQPASAVAQPRCYECYSAWLQENASLAALAMKECDFTLGLRKAGDETHGDLTRPLDITVQPSATWEGNEPQLIICVVRSGDEKEVFRTIEEIKPTLSSPQVSGTITYAEEKAEGSAPREEQK